MPGHFNVPLVLEVARPLGKGFECYVRPAGRHARRNRSFSCRIALHPRPVKHLDHANKEVVAARFFDIPAAAIEAAAARLGGYKWVIRGF